MKNRSCVPSIPAQTPTGLCAVCNSVDVVLDEVELESQRTLQLGECRHCGHRWTHPIEIDVLASLPVRHFPPRAA